MMKRDRRDFESTIEATGAIKEKIEVDEVTEEALLLSFLTRAEDEWMHRKCLKTMNIPRLCISGGARGADVLWCKSALESGLKVQIMSFQKHAVVGPDAANVIMLEEKSLREANSSLTQASSSLKRKLPSPTSYTRKLLQRNWWIIKDADAVFAISKIDPKGNGLRVEGGTAWGCEMYWLARRTKQLMSLYLYDMNRAGWYQATRAGNWEKCGTPSLMQFGRVAMIGSRELTAIGKTAIKEVFRLYEQEQT